MNSRTVTCAVAAAAVFAASLCSAADIDERRYLADLKQLTSVKMKGRASGSPELDRAAHFIAKEFRRAGIRPLLGDSYLQPFPVSVKSTVGAGNRVCYTLDGVKTELKLGDSFSPFSFSSSSTVKGESVFAGYGITAPEYNYDDYAGIDTHGKIVVLLRHEPQEFDSGSVFEGRVYSEHSQLFSKAVNARAHGAIGIIYVNDTANHGSDSLEKFVSLPGPADTGIPFVQISSEHADKWFLSAGRNFRAIQEEIDKTLRPQSFAFPDTFKLDITTDVQHVSRDVYNVAGYLPGASDEYIVIGAHYDHLGLGEQYSLAPEKAGTIHPGADDNASGSAGLIALARYFGSHPRPTRGVLFLAFAGEELGLLGSSHYVNHPLVPLDHASVMINMDMIGRVRDKKVMVGGAPAGSRLRRILDTLGPKYDLDLDLSDTTVYGSSDHTSFKAKRVPTLFFFSGLHADYHRPTDTWEKIEVPGTVRLLRLIAEMVTILATPSGKPSLAYNIRNRFNIASINPDTSAMIPSTIPQECWDSAKGRCFRFMPYTPVITNAGVAIVPKIVRTFIT
jgi:aminopeptidase YwaD